MKPAICGGCKKGSKCRLRQPGTWVVECDGFEKRPVPMPTGVVSPGLAELEEQRADQPCHK